jgi:hemerythrin-like metal-binding protein
MAYMNWTPSLETGHVKIDSEHKTLVKALNRLHAAMKEWRGKAEVGEILIFLRDYTVTHFKTEENLMALHRYPGAVAHTAIHEALIKQVAELVQKYEAGQGVLTLSVLDFLERWLVDHIGKEDKDLAAFLDAKGIAA